MNGWFSERHDEEEIRVCKEIHIYTSCRGVPVSIVVGILEDLNRTRDLRLVIEMKSGNEQTFYGDKLKLKLCD
jgi:hypothetical protein